MSSFSKVRKRINKEINTFKNNVDEEGRSIINITIYNDNDFLSPYSTSNEEILTEDTAKFLEHSAMTANPKNPLHINIYSDEIDSVEKEKYPKAIKNYYFNQLVDIQQKLKHNLIVSLIFTLASIIIFLAEFSFVQSLIKNDTINELINIIGWVFMWEAVDQFCIERSHINRQKYRYLNIMEAKLTFHKLKEKNKQIKK